MLFEMSIWEIVSSILVFFIGLTVATGCAGLFKTSSRKAITLYVWHTVFCFLYFWYATSNSSDASHYYYQSLNGGVTFSLGTDAVTFITAFFSNILRLSFLGTSLIYNIFGFIGLMAFDAALRFAVFKKKRNVRLLAKLIIFLPSVSFWSAGLGKDSLAFLSAGMILWAALNFKERVWVMVPSVLIMLLVRPHIAGILILSLTVSIIMQKRVSPIFRVLYGVLAIAVSLYLVPIGLKYTNLENVESTEEVQKYIANRARNNMEGGGSVDISKMSVPLKVVTYLFRPLPFEAHSIFSFAASLDNVVLLYLFIVGMSETVKKRYKSTGENRVFMWTYSLFCLFILSGSTANLGISVRQKWMFTPMLIFLMISVIGKRERRQQNSIKQRSFSINSSHLQIPEQVQLSEVTSRTGSITDLSSGLL